MKALKSYIPEELMQFKNEWLTMRSFERICYFEKDGEGRSSPYVLRKLNMRPVKRPHQNVSGYVQFWNFKEALARAAAHGYECKALSEVPVVDDRPPQVRVVESPDVYDLRQRCKTLELRLDEAESELVDLRQMVEESKRMVRMALEAKPIANEPGVYFLCDDKEVVYVGMSAVSVTERVEGRAQLMRLTKMIPARTKTECADLERKWIKFLKPRANKALVN